MTQETIDDLKRALLELLLDEAGEPADFTVHQVPRASRAASIPASREQERLWFLSQLGAEPGINASAIYLMSMALRLEGRLDVECLRRAFASVIARHESLRTALVMVGDELRQVICEQIELPWQMFDMTSLTQEEYAQALQAQEQHFSTASMDLAQAPLLRIGLVKRSAEDHVLLLTQHHAISDGWSIGVLLKEMSQLYSAYLRGEANPLLPLSIQYADYAVWQRSAGQAEVLADQLAYWKRQLSGLPPLLSLPTDRPRPAVQSFAGAQCRAEISEEVTRALQALSQSQGVTLFMTLTAAFGLLLGRYANQTDVALGTPIANRTRQELEGVVGCFVNTLVLRADLSGEPSFLELLQRIKQTCLQAYANQAVPFEQLVTVLNPERSLSHSSLIQTMLTLHTEMEEPAGFENLKVTDIGEEASIAKFDLTLMLSEDSGRLRGRFSYNTDLFDGVTIERLRNHFLNLLETIVQHPSRAIDRIPLTTEVERQQLVAEWGQVHADHPCDQTVTQLFESQVCLTPANVAVHFESQRLTYAEVNAKANQLARHLRVMGMGSETIVAVCMERSLDLLIALLATLKSGGVYMPLDLASPRDRLAYQLTDAKPGILLTQQHLWSILPEHSVPVFCVEDQGLELEAYDPANLQDPPSPQNLAYIIYTSGSSGRPKGCLIEHRQLAITLLAAKEVLGFASTDELPNIATSAFDISLLELLLPLISGGATRLLDQSQYKDLRYLVAQTRTATFFHAVPSLMSAWLDHLENLRDDSYPALRCLLVGGEAVSPALLQALAARFPQAELIELYGPTTASSTPGRLLSAVSISPSSMRKPRILTWLSIRPRYSSVPSARYRTRSPVR